MSFISPRQSRSHNYGIVTRLGVATTALFWLVAPMASAQLAPPSVTAQNPGTQVPNETNELFVNPTSGNDETGNGSEEAPFKTIAHALREARPNTAIVLSPGTYSAQTGERFPLMLKPEVRIVGNPDNRGRGIVIQGGGNYLSRSSAGQNVAIVGAEGARVSGITLTNPNPGGYGLWMESIAMEATDNTFTGNSHDGISVVGDGSPRISGNHFVENGANGITIYGSSRAELRDNVFERTGFGINVGENAAPMLIGNRSIYNRDGVVIHGKARPVLRNNQIEQNRENGIVAVGDSRPDLGTTNDPGGNVLRYNGELDINASASKQILPAYGNQVASDRTSGRLDLNGAIDPTLSAPVASNPPPRPLPQPTPAPTPSPSFPAPTAFTPQTPPPAPIAASVPMPTEETPIPIPVPPPQTSSAPAPSPAPRISAPAIGNRPGDTLPSLLPVPDPNAPIGNGGSSVPDVVVSQNPSNGNAPPPPPSHAATLGLRYRVIVEASSASEQDRVRRIVSDAFRTRINGRMVMQVGAFATQDKVDEMMELLQRNGLRGIVLDIE